MARTELTRAVALVTGAASGLGRALCRQLGEAGAHVVGADLEPERAAEVCPQVVELDVADRAAFAAAADRVRAEHGRIDLLINDAGVVVGGPVERMADEHWDAPLAVDLGGVVNGVMAVYPHMVERKAGHVVNVGSLAGLVPSGWITPYAAAKFGVTGLTLALWQEARAHGVGVTLACPGGIETAILDRAAPTGVIDLTDGAMDVRTFVQRSSGPLVGAEVIAAAILRGVERRRMVVLSPWTAHAAWMASRVAPTLAVRVAGGMVAYERRREELTARRRAAARAGDPARR